MSEENQAEFAFLVAKQADGRIAIGKVDTEQMDREPTLDDIYSALNIILRDMQVQQTVMAVLGTLSQANGQQPSGLVIPDTPAPTQRFQKVTRK